MAKKAAAAHAFGHQDAKLPSLECRLIAAKKAAIDNFTHGMVKAGPLKKNPFVKIVSSMTNSPGATQQTAFGDQNQQSDQQQASAILQTIGDLLASEEFKRLNEPNRADIQDIADAVRDELAKASPDEPKVNRWLKRLLGLATEFGMQVAASALANLVLG